MSAADDLDEGARAEVAAAVARVVRPGVVVIAGMAIVAIVIGCALPGYDVHDERGRWIGTDPAFGISLGLVLAAVAAGGIAVWREPRATMAALWAVLGWSLMCGPLLLMVGHELGRFLDESRHVARWPADVAPQLLLLVLIALPVLSIVAALVRAGAHHRARRRRVPVARARRSGAKARSPVA